MPNPSTIQAQLESQAADRIEALQKLYALRPTDGLGVALAFLLHMLDTEPAVLHLALRARVEHPDHPATDIISLFTQLTA